MKTTSLALLHPLILTKYTVTLNLSPSRALSLPQCIWILHLLHLTVKKLASSINIFNPCFHLPPILPPTPSLPSPPEARLEALNSINPTKAPGMDGIGPNFLKTCALAICDPLLHLFTQCLSQQNIPSVWRSHCITPVFKLGDRSSINNYRPISLLSCTSKWVIYNKVINFLMDHVITTNQFGFLPNRSATQQLLTFVHSVYSSHQNHASIYLDFSKALDKVSHPELLFKLWRSGITGSIWHWFQAYLSNRQQCVSINGHHSSLIPDLLGVSTLAWPSPLPHLY